MDMDELTLFGQQKQTQVQLRNRAHPVKTKCLNAVDEFIGEFKRDDFRNTNIVNVLELLKMRINTF
jgi:hypothetical protein